MVASHIGLEGQIYFMQGRVQIEVKPEAVVLIDDHSALLSVPVVVYSRDRQKVGHLTYDAGKQIFITALTDFFPEADEGDPELNHSAMMHVAGKYSAMLDLGHVKVREVLHRDEEGKVLEENVYESYYDYLVSVGQRELEEFKKRNPKNKTSP